MASSYGGGARSVLGPMIGRTLPRACALTLTGMAVVVRLTQRLDIDDFEEPARWRAVHRIIMEDYLQRLQRSAPRVTVTEEGLTKASRHPRPEFVIHGPLKVCDLVSLGGEDTPLCGPERERHFGWWLPD